MMNTRTIDRGQPFPGELSHQVKERFLHVNQDFMGRSRLSF
jgi:hypothetical protein